MIWPVATVVAAFSTSILLSAVYLYLYFRRKELHVGIWTTSWILVAVRYLTELWMLVYGPTKMGRAFVPLAVLGAGLLLVWGTLLFLRKDASRFWLLALGFAAGDVVRILFSVQADLSSTLLLAPTFWFIAGIYALTGWIFLNSLDYRHSGSTVVGLSFLFLSLELLLEPFLNAASLQWGHIVAAGLQLLIAGGMLIIYFDRATRDLERSEERYHSLLSTMPDGFILVDPNGVVKMVNQRACELIGHSGEDGLIGQDFFDLFLPEERLRAMENVRKLQAGWDITCSEFTIRRADGSTCAVEITSSLAENAERNPIGHIAILRDINDRKAAEDALRSSESHFRSLIENSSDVVVVIAADGKIVYDSPSMSRLSGYDPQELIRQDPSSFIHPDDLPGLKKSMQSLLTRPGAVEPVEARYRTKSGCYRYFEGTATNLLDDATVSGIVVNVHDVTDRVRVEQALRESERFLSTLMGNLPGMAYRRANDDSWTMEYVSEGCEALTGYQPADLIANRPVSYGELVHPEDRKQLVADMRAALQKGEAFQIEYRIITRWGEEKWVWERGRRVRNEQGDEKLEGFIADVSEHKRSEQVQQALYAISEAAHEASTVEQLCDAIHRVIKGLMYAKNLYLALYDRESGWVRFPYFVDERESIGKKPGAPRRNGRGSTEYILRHGCTLLATPEDVRRLHEQGEVDTTNAILPASFLGVPLKNKAGEAIGVIAVQSYDSRYVYTAREREILEFVSSQVSMAIQRKSDEEALAESEERYRSFVSYFQGIAYRATANLIPTFYHGAVEKITGYSEEELLRREPKWLDIIFPEDLPAAQTFTERLRSEPGFSGECDYRIARKDGEIRWVRDYGSSVVDESGKVIGLQGAVYDITEQKLAAEALRDSESRYRRLFNNAQDAIFVYSLTVEGDVAKFSEVNDVACEMLGYSREELLRISPMDIIRQPNSESIAAEYQKLVSESEAIFERVLVSKDGSEIPVEVSAHLFELQGKPTVLYTARDIRERRKAELVLRVMYEISEAANQAGEPEQLYSAIHQSVRRLMYAENLFVALYDRELDRVSFPYFSDRRETTPASRRSGWGIVEYILRSGRSLLATPKILWKLDREKQLELTGPVPISFLGVPLNNSSGEPIGVLAVRSYDPDSAYTERELELLEFVSKQIALAILRKQAQDAYREASKALQAVIEASPLAIYTLTPEGVVMAWNRAAERIFGWSAEEILGRRLPMPASKWDGFIDTLKKVLAGQPFTGVELVRQRKDGSDIDISLSAAPLHDAQGVARGVVAVAADITEQKKLERQLLQAQRLEAVGRMAGGIAHDFNNLLTAITGYADFVKGSLEPDDPAQADIGEILHAAERARRLTQQLLAFSSRQMIQPKVIDLNELIDDMQERLVQLLGTEISLVVTPGHDLWPVRVDPIQIEQVVVNLTANARDAMPEGGTLTIRTANVVLQEPQRYGVLELPPGDYVQLAMADTGIGMTEEVRERLFEPFFSTKKGGPGNGLGLPTVHGVIKQHGGAIQVRSSLGEGSEFTIYLPRAQEETGQEPEKLGSGAAPRGSETILLVEDELTVRNVTARNLRALGYEVIEATDGPEALALARQCQGRIDLLLTDVVMPEMNGPELARRLLQEYPHVKVLYVSGYTDDAIPADAASQKGVAFLQKPFSAEALASAVRAILEA